MNSRSRLGSVLRRLSFLKLNAWMLRILSSFKQANPFPRILFVPKNRNFFQESICDSQFKIFFLLVLNPVVKESEDSGKADTLANQALILNTRTD